MANTFDMDTDKLRSGMEQLGAEFVHGGKVREVYKLPNGQLALIATNRISAFDVILPKEIPYKGEILNRISWHMLQATKHIVPNWAEAMPDPQVTIGTACTPFKVEMVVRNYLTGSWWRLFNNGTRQIGDVTLLGGMKQFDRFSDDGPIVTPTTKAEGGEHDEDISKAEAVRRGLCTAEQWEIMVDYSLKLFREGTRLALEKGLVFCDTKYEFGLTLDGCIILIDEVNTPDSSRYYYAKGFDEAIAGGKEPEQLSKEFVRQWLLSQPGFDPKRPKETMPNLTRGKVTEVSGRYMLICEYILGQEFEPLPVTVSIGPEARIIAVIAGSMQSERV